MRLLDDVGQGIVRGFMANFVAPPAVQIVRSKPQVQEVCRDRARGTFEFGRIGTAERVGPTVEVVLLGIFGHVPDRMKVRAVVPQSSRQGLLQQASRVLATY